MRSFNSVSELLHHGVGRGSTGGVESESWLCFSRRFVFSAAPVRASHVWLCDPEHLLSAEEEAVVQAKLLKLRDTRAHVCADGQSHPFQVKHAAVSGNPKTTAHCLHCTSLLRPLCASQLAVAVVPDIYVGESRTAQDAADTMARELLLYVHLRSCASEALGMGDWLCSLGETFEAQVMGSGEPTVSRRPPFSLR